MMDLDVLVALTRAWATYLAADLATKPFEYLGMACGMAGAFFVSGYSRRAALGWILWLVSNVAWLVSGFATGAVPLIVQNLYFMACNLRGLYNGHRASRAHHRHAT